MNTITVNRLFGVLAVLMVGGLIHTLVTSNGCDKPSVTVNLVASVDKLMAKPVKPITVSYQYSNRDILLAKLIQERFSDINYKEDLLIAQCINKDTKGISWPTPLAVASIIEIESQYNKDAISDCGAKGLMQISPIWSNQVPSTAYTTISGNIEYGVKILHQYYQRYDGNKMAAILSYNSGNNSYNAGKAWPEYWWRYKDAKIAFDKLYQMSV